MKNQITTTRVHALLKRDLSVILEHSKFSYMKKYLSNTNAKAFISNKYFFDIRKSRMIKLLKPKGNENRIPPEKPQFVTMSIQITFSLV